MEIFQLLTHQIFIIYIIVGSDCSGLISNLASMMTLLSVHMRKQTFNQLLAILAAIDIL